LRESAALLVDSNVDSAIICDYRVCAQLLILDLAWKLRVCGRSVVGVRCIVIGDLVDVEARL
jgi:hypothetical protein